MKHFGFSVQISVLQSTVPKNVVFTKCVFEPHKQLVGGCVCASLETRSMNRFLLNLARAHRVLVSLDNFNFQIFWGVFH